jgi:prevent-host-death family protein
MKTHRARTQPRKRSPARRRKALPRELNVGEARALFSQLVDEAARGASFVIAKAGTPVARIVPLEAEPRKLVFGTMKGLLSPEVEQALLDAIEAPLPDDVLASFHIGRLEAPE